MVGQIDEAIKAVNAASSSSSGGAQWILCAFAIAAMFFVWVMFQYFMKREERREDKFSAHNERELSVSAERTKAVEEHNRLLLLVSEKVDRILERMKP